MPVAISCACLLGLGATCCTHGVERRLGHQHPPRRAARSRRSNPTTGDTETPVNVAGTLVHVDVVARPWPPAGSCPSSFSALRIAAMSLVFGAANASSSISTTSSSRILRGQRHPRGQLQRLARQAVRPSRADAWRRCDRRHGGYRCAASRPGRCPCPSGDTSSSSSRPLRRGVLVLAVPCRRFAWYITTDVVQQLLADARRQLGRVDLVRSRPPCPVRSNTVQLGHDRLRPTSKRSTSAAGSLVAVRVTVVRLHLVRFLESITYPPLGPGTAPRTSSRLFSASIAHDA